ncbi:MAG TPA: flagellar basal body P-ring formation chaperone FlgA, partial [Alphaproteobacteria bacterium]
IGAEISLSQPVEGIIVPGHEKPLLTVTNIAYDALSQNFTATVLASRDGKILNKTLVAGLATEMTDVPVLTAPIERGAIIGNADVSTVRMPKKSLRLGIVDHLNDIVGMAAKRNLRANETLDKASLMSPVLVRRNQIVTVTYKNGPITLSTKARAMANAARGETVQLENPTSKKIIEAVVTGPQQTTVQMDTTIVING